MVGFGELRRLSVQWQVDIADVERAYAIEGLLTAIFEQSILSHALVLHDSSALLSPWKNLWASEWYCMPFAIIHHWPKSRVT